MIMNNKKNKISKSKNLSQKNQTLKKLTQIWKIK